MVLWAVLKLLLFMRSTCIVLLWLSEFVVAKCCMSHCVQLMLICENKDVHDPLLAVLAELHSHCLKKEEHFLYIKNRFLGKFQIFFFQSFFDRFWQIKGLSCSKCLPLSYKAIKSSKMLLWSPEMTNLKMTIFKRNVSVYI